MTTSESLVLYVFCPIFFCRLSGDGVAPDRGFQILKFDAWRFLLTFNHLSFRSSHQGVQTHVDGVPPKAKTLSRSFVEWCEERCGVAQTRRLSGVLRRNIEVLVRNHG